MKINIVTEPSPGWALRMLAENWNKFIPNSTITTIHPCLKSDINFYVNYAIFYKKTNIDIGLFTHREEDSEKKQNFDRKSLQMDYCLCLSKNTLVYLPKNKSAIVKHGIGEEYINKREKIKFGIIGRDYESGRKNFNVVEKLKKIPNSEFFISGGKLSKYEIINLYNEIDYLLVTSTNEGGPTPVIEAFTMGVPVIAPNVGFCWEYPVLKYNNFEELFNIINTLCSFVDVNRVWEQSSNQVQAVCEDLYYKYSK